MYVCFLGMIMIGIVTNRPAGASRVPRGLTKHLVPWWWSVAIAAVGTFVPGVATLSRSPS